VYCCRDCLNVRINPPGAVAAMEADAKAEEEMDRFLDRGGRLS
jgi:hypothetical protein